MTKTISMGLVALALAFSQNIMAETNSSVRSDDCETTRHADQIFNLSFPPQAATFRLLVTTKRRGDEMPVFDKDLRFKKRCGGAMFCGL